MGRPVRWRASLSAASTASVPELHRNTRAPARSIGGPGGEAVGDVGVGGQVEVARAVVQHLVDLGVDGGVDVGVGVPGGDHGDAGVEVQEAVAVDVLEHAAPAPPHHERVHPRQRRAGDGLVASDDRRRRRARQVGEEAGRVVEQRQRERRSGGAVSIVIGTS